MSGGTKYVLHWVPLSGQVMTSQGGGSEPGGGTRYCTLQGRGCTSRGALSRGAVTVHHRGSEQGVSGTVHYREGALSGGYQVLYFTGSGGYQVLYITGVGGVPGTVHHGGGALAPMI